jgi:hypothetical protein
LPDDSGNYRSFVHYDENSFALVVQSSECLRPVFVPWQQIDAPTLLALMIDVQQRRCCEFKEVSASA